eukprot:gnl/Dysnectes_brevis/3743_a4804_707.p1 GENE.gnl/Dysnectes_brevis/3743_a4804_707~~gnl/Dysnectes_brevis/3743_a4804_707.p1  ORF type:complete len:239 (+),score=39.58 gnl/Dysnectes_brevis/3743_a4804_707:90-806(+)
MISIILPTYNERQNILVMCYHIRKALFPNPFEIIIVDDNSPDGTVESVKALQSHDHYSSHIKLLRRPSKLGLGSAYRCAAKHLSPESSHVCIMDADLSHDPHDIPRMLSTLQKSQADLVCATRYSLGGGVAGWSPLRKIISAGANTLATTLLVRSAGLTDLTTSFRIISRESFGLLLPSVRSEGFSFQMELVVRAVSAGMVVCECPVAFPDRVAGESKMAVGEIVGFAGKVWRLWTGR